MGLKDDLIEAKAQSALAAGANPNDIDTSAGSAIEVEADLTKDAIVNFLTQCEFRVTQLAAPVVLEDFNIPPQQGDILPSVTSTDIPYPAGVPAAAVPVPLTGGRSGVLTKNIDVNKAGGTTGVLDSTGYVLRITILILELVLIYQFVKVMIKMVILQPLQQQLKL